MARETAGKRVNIQRDRGRGLLTMLVFVLVAVAAAVLLLARLTAIRLDSTTRMVAQTGATLQHALDGTETRMGDVGRRVERMLAEIPAGQLESRLSQELSEYTFSPDLPGALLLNAVLPDGSRIAMRFADADGDGAFLPEPLPVTVFRIPDAADGGRHARDTFWGEDPDATDGGTGARPVNTLYRTLSFPGGRGLIAYTFDLDGVAAGWARLVPVPATGWLVGDRNGQLLSWRLPAPRVPTGTLAVQPQEDPAVSAAHLLDETEELNRRIGVFQNQGAAAGRPVHVFPTTLRNGWHFVAVIPSQILLGEQIGVMWVFCGMTGLLLLVLLAARHREKRRLAADIRYAVDAFGQYPAIVVRQRQDGGAGTIPPESLPPASTHAASAHAVGGDSASGHAAGREPVSEPALPDDSEIAVLVMAARSAFHDLRRQYEALEGESARNRQLASDISRFYSHVRVLNGQGFRIDFFEYHAAQRRFLFLTGLATLFGAGSQIYREMDDVEFFERFACDIGMQDPEPAREPADGSSGRSLADFRDLAADCLATGQPFSFEMRATSMDDGVLWLRCWGRPDPDTGRIDGALLDITGEVRQRETDRSRFLTDGITGFYSRNALAEVGGRILAERGPGEMLTFIYFGLKQYGDFEARFGMMAANGYIRAFADLLREHIGENHAMFRWWGPDFLCIVRGFQSAEAVLENGRRVLGKVVSQRRSVNGVLADFPLSVGYAVAGIHGDTPAELLEHAAFAKHEVASGLAENLNEFNRIRYDEARQVTLRRSFIRDMIERNDLYVVYQPIVSLKSGEVFGFEALSRPANRIYRTIGELIDDAEDTGHYAILERRMVYNALDGFMERPERFRDACLFINTAPSQSLTEADYLDIRDRYFGFMRVVYEVIERSRIDPDEMLRRKAMVRDSGAKFALDDFGSGYSNHLALLALEPDIIKIDRGLVQGVDRDPRKQQMLEDIIGYARQGGTRVLAEGVETRGELSALCRMGVDYAQGFHLGRPAVAFGGVAEEAAAVIRGMTRSARPDPGHAVSVATRTFSFRDPAMSRHAVLSGWLILRLATEWGMDAADALLLSIAGILPDAAALLSDEADWRNVEGREGALRAHAAAGLAEAFLPGWPWAHAVRRLHERGADETDATRILGLADRLAFQADAGSDALRTEGFLRVLEGLAWPAGQRLARLMPQLAEEAVNSVWVEDWFGRLHGIQEDGDLTEGLLRLLAHVVDARSRHMAGHAAEMEKAAEMLAVMRKQGWHMAERIRLAALCRDLGNLAVPASLFDKQGRLTAQEMEQFRTHAVRSRDLLATVGLTDLAELQAPSAERGPHAEAPMEKDVVQGRAILEVADVLTALLQDRAWRPAMTRPQAAAVLTEMASAGMLDPLVCETAIENLDVLAEGIQSVRRSMREKLRLGAPRLQVVSGGAAIHTDERNRT